jgi:hypothetical protein
VTAQEAVDDPLVVLAVVDAAAGVDAASDEELADDASDDPAEDDPPEDEVDAALPVALVPLVAPEDERESVL